MTAGTPSIFPWGKGVGVSVFDRPFSPLRVRRFPSAMVRRVFYVGAEGGELEERVERKMGV